MPRRPAAYPPAYCEQIIALARAGRSPKAQPDFPTIAALPKRVESTRRLNADR